jgi:hypothetical protein
LHSPAYQHTTHTQVLRTCCSPCWSRSNMQALQPKTTCTTKGTSRAAGLLLQVTRQLQVAGLHGTPQQTCPSP